VIARLLGLSPLGLSSSGRPVAARSAFGPRLLPMTREDREFWRMRRAHAEAAAARRAQGREKNNGQA